jgi:ankyrin repeat protein
MSQQNKTPKQDKIANSSKDANKISEKETKHIKDSKPSKSTPKQDQSKSTKSTNEKSDETQLFALVETGQLQDFIDLMSTKEINVSRLTDELKRTVLHIAVLKGHIRVIKYLLTLDSDPCDPNAVDQHKQSVLHYAAHTGDSDVFNILKEHDVNFNCKDVFGRTALHHAAMHGSVSSVQWLVDNSLSKRDTLMHWINQKDMLGSNALHWAAVKGKHDVVKFLVARGINVHLRAGNSWTAAGLAEQALKDQVHNWLRHYITYGNNLMKYVTNRLKGGSPPKDSSTSSNSVSANGRNKEETARDLRQEARRETLLDVRNNLSAHVKAFDKWKTTERADGSFIQFYRNRHGMTALHMAAKYGDFLIVSELIHTHKFCLSSTDYYGRTPLHYAALYGHTSTALLLTHISRGYREEDTYRHFVAGDYTNGLSSSTSEGQNDDDDYDTDVRVSHWKLKTATNLLPSQMAQHGHLHHVHYDSLLSQRLSFSETDHKKSMDIYKSKKDDSYSNETKHNGNNGNSGTCSSSSMITDEMSKARRQLMPGFEEENNGELNNSSNGSSGVGSVGSGNGKGNSNSNNSGSSGTSSNNIGAVNDDNKGGTATSTTTVTTTTTTTTPDDTKEVVGGGDTKSNHDRSSEDITKSVTVIDEAAPVTNGDDQVRNRAADRSLSGGSFPEKDVTSDTSDQDTKREDESGRQDVYNWLEKAGLAQYTEKFLENGWETTDALILLEKTNLEQMGVLPGHCAVILKNIQERKGVSFFACIFCFTFHWNKAEPKHYCIFKLCLIYCVFCVFMRVVCFL